jgi:hypothetical protein
MFLCSGESQGKYFFFSIDGPNWPMGTEGRVQRRRISLTVSGSLTFSLPASSFHSTMRVDFGK